MAEQLRLSTSACRLSAASVASVIVLLGSFALAAVDLMKMESLARERYGQKGVATVRDWRAMIDESKQKPERQRLEDANNFFNNRVRWVEDTQAWGEKDYWATPLEVMGAAQGDCEDFAIAKYMTLLLAGVDVDKLRITYVKTIYQGVNTAHMVLAYYPSPGAVPLILDNIVVDIRSANERKDLAPVFGFNSDGLWVGGAATPATKNPGSKLSRWRGLLARAAAEGLG